MTQYQLLLSLKVTSLCPIIHLIMIKNCLLLSQKKHLIQSPNLSWYDLISSSPVPKHHLVKSKKMYFYDHKSTSPAPKSQLVLSHISSCYGPMSTSPVPKSHCVLSYNLSCYAFISTSHIPISHLVCPILHLLITLYQLLLSPKSHSFVPSFIWLWPYTRTMSLTQKY